MERLNTSTGQSYMQFSAPQIHIGDADGHAYALTQVSLKQGLFLFKDAGMKAVCDEMQQLHHRGTFTPIRHTSLSPIQMRQVLETHLFLQDKRDGRIKGRMVAGGDKQRVYTPNGMLSLPRAQLRA